MYVGRQTDPSQHFKVELSLATSRLHDFSGWMHVGLVVDVDVVDDVLVLFSGGAVIRTIERKSNSVVVVVVVVVDEVSVVVVSVVDVLVHDGLHIPQDS